LEGRPVALEPVGGVDAAVCPVSEQRLRTRALDRRPTGDLRGIRPARGQQDGDESDQHNGQARTEESSEERATRSSSGHDQPAVLSGTASLSTASRSRRSLRAGNRPALPSNSTTKNWSAALTTVASSRFAGVTIAPRCAGTTMKRSAV